MTPTGKRGAAALIVLLSCLSLPASTAYADGPGQGSEGQTEESGETQGNELVSKVSFDLSKNSTSPSSGPLTVDSSSNWTPPPCWYEPAYTPEELRERHEEVKNLPHASGLGEAVAEFEKHYIEGHPYKNYNLAKKDDGMWWDRAALPPEEGGDIFACMKPPFWVENGEPPQVENAITPEVLAELAYAKMRVPDTKVELSPKEANQKVNLDTWAWLDESEFKPVSVTASLPELDLRATTTATPVSLKLEPGTEEADVYPSSGECGIGENGRIGAPYTKKAEGKTPPCGMTYRRANTGTDSYAFKATVTWKIEWTGTGDAGGDLPDGTFGTTQDVTVQEVQAINR